MKWRLSLFIGLLTTVTIVVTSSSVYLQSAKDFGVETEIALHALAGTVARSIDPVRLDALQTFRDPYYEELRAHLHRITTDFNLSWLGVYRLVGSSCRHIADGEDLGNGFVLDYPIMSVPEELTRAAQGTPTDTGTYEDAFGSWQSSFHPILRKDGTVAAVIDASRNLTQLGQFKSRVVRRTIFLGAMLTLLTLGLGFLYARSVSRPVAELSEAAERIAAGRLSTRIPAMQSTTEINVLVESFNHMATELERSQFQLERKLAELTILHETSQKVTLARTSDEILQTILSKSLEGLQAAWGNILLYSDEEGLLVERVAQDPPGAPAREPVQIRPDEGLAGRSFTDLSPLMTSQTDGRALLPFGPRYPQTAANMLSVPLLIDGKPIGALNLFDRVSGAFSVEEVWLASTLASQMAVSVEKARLYEQAITDGLTRLYVHRYFQLAMDNELKRSKRYQTPFSLILLDIDHFKTFNDTWGHQTGDQVLAVTAQILRKSLRGADVPARYGGEEFAVILPQTAPRDAYEVAERIRKAVEAHELPNRGQPLKVTISLGVAAWPTHAAEKLELIKKADAALYESKHRGRNRTTLFDDTFIGEAGGPQVPV